MKEEMRNENKDFMNTKELSSYLGVSVAYVHKLTFRKEIPYYKPNGKMCFFKREDVDNWIIRNRVSSNEEMEQKAQNYCMNNGAVR